MITLNNLSITSLNFIIYIYIYYEIK